jgi:hypothetical protein
MKPRNNCGFEMGNVALGISNYRFRRISAEVTHATTIASDQCSLAAEGSPTPDVLHDRVSTNPDPSSNGVAVD